MGWGEVALAPYARHCEEPLRRSNPETLRGKILDCFAPLAMTVMEAGAHDATGVVLANARTHTA
ncbi:hypothetical protein XI09_18275 [Bradyrhizobium sp. CCBAU 11386]|nr:hypothetical protein [Bradyrhizobium sp. CCBAU 11386]